MPLHRSAAPTSAPVRSPRVILTDLNQVADDLDACALVVISDTRIRAPPVPAKPSD